VLLSTNDPYRPAGPSEVIVTGTFDNWSQSLPLVKTSKGDFEITLPLKPENAADERVVFKFVVDGEWKTSQEYEIANEDGNINNIIYYSNLTTDSTTARIPESGGLFVGVTNDKASTTVLPSSEGQQDTRATGEPGIVIPSNPQEIKEFSEVSNVDSKELNAKLNAKDVNTTVLPSTEGKQDTTATGEPGIVIPSNANDIEEFTQVSNVEAKELNAQLNGEKKTKTTKVKKVIKRNKVTGEETVVSSEPVEDEVKTLDPKTATSGTREIEAKPVEQPKQTPTATPKKEVKPQPKKTAPKKEEKKEEKKGFFRKLKKLL
jgi:hypothetical protein